MLFRSDQGAEPALEDRTRVKQPTLTFEEWRRDKGFIYNSKEEYEAALPALQAQYQQEISGEKPAAPAVAPTVEPVAKAEETAPPKVVSPLKEPKAAAVTGKKTKATKAAPITADYLNSETFYGGASPTAIVNERKADKNNTLDTDPVNVGIMNAGHEVAFDAYDTVAYKTGVYPELKAIAEEKNKGQQVKRQQMRKELSGKVDPETGKKYSEKRITALVSNIPIYKAGDQIGRAHV